MAGRISFFTQQIRIVIPMGHDHAHGSGVTHRPKLIIVLTLTLSVVVLQVVFGLLSNSLALIADAGHMLSDSFGLAMALAAIAIAQRAGGANRTFGLHRVEILAAGMNGLLLIGLCVVIVISAIGRIGDAPEVDGPMVLIVGSVGLAVNIAGLFLLRSGAQENLNMRGAYLEVLGDAIGSVAVLVSALVIVFTGWNEADIVASFMIAVLIVPRAISLLREVVHVLLEGAPRDVDLAELRDHIRELDGVVDVHDLHVWTVTSGMPIMSAHVVVDDATMADSHGVLDRLRVCLAEHFDVEHSTFQIEPVDHAATEDHVHP